MTAVTILPATYGEHTENMVTGLGSVLANTHLWGLSKVAKQFRGRAQTESKPPTCQVILFFIFYFCCVMLL